jgi:copper chaperone CopZ
MKTATFKIDGMHCEGCAQTITALVAQEPGVKQAEVSFAACEARILYDPKTTGEEQLIAAIQKPGYRVVRQQ